MLLTDRENTRVIGSTFMRAPPRLHSAGDSATDSKVNPRPASGNNAEQCAQEALLRRGLSICEYLSVDLQIDFTVASRHEGITGVVERQGSLIGRLSRIERIIPWKKKSSAVPS